MTPRKIPSRIDRLADAGRPEAIEEGLRLVQPVEQDRPDPEADEGHVGDGPARLEEAAGERPAADAARLVDQRERGQSPEQSEPDGEHLAVRTPLVATELGHHREGVGRVAEQDDEQHRWPATAHRELEPDEGGEADHARPATEAGRVVGRLPRPDPKAPDDGGADVVERRERIEELPDRSDDRGDHRHADPAVDPQEERRDVAGRRTADHALDDDPEPGDESEGPERDGA